MDDTTFDRLLNIQSYNDAALKDLVRRLSEEERELSRRRRLLHGEIDIVRAELVRRLRDKHAAGEDLVTEGDLSALTDILAGRGPHTVEEQGAPKGAPSAPATEREKTSGRPVVEHDAAQDVRRRFKDWSVSVRDERYIRHILGQLKQGRRLDDILADNYIMTHTSEAKRAELIQNPLVMAAVGEEIRKQFEIYGSGTRSTREKPEAK